MVARKSKRPRSSRPIDRTMRPRSSRPIEPVGGPWSGTGGDDRTNELPLDVLRHLFTDLDRGDVITAGVVDRDGNHAAAASRLRYTNNWLLRRLCYQPEAAGLPAMIRACYSSIDTIPSLDSGTLYRL